MNEVIKALQYVRYDILFDNGYLICSVPNIEHGYYETEINTAGDLFITVDYGTN
jgi:hypothetical protein